MSQTSNKKMHYSVDEVCQAIDTLSPPHLAQSWDNVGLIAGDRTDHVKRVLLCIDLTPLVADEVVKTKSDFVLAYHPPIFKPISSLTAPGKGAESALLRCIRAGTAIYATHTALDAARSGTNDVVAELCGIKHCKPLEFTHDSSSSECKLVVFVPSSAVEKVAQAIFNAGAGHIGDYSQCSYRLVGLGTFLGGESTNPTIGQRGKMEFVDEIRLETVVPLRDLPRVIDALRTAHPYEEPALDIYPLTPKPVYGIGRVGQLPRPTTLQSLARKLKKAIEADVLSESPNEPRALARADVRQRVSNCIQIVGWPERKIERAIIVVGAAGSLPFRIPLCETDVIITGEIRHHDALTILRHNAAAIALGHWTSERPVLKPLADRLTPMLPGIDIAISKADRDPFQGV